MKEITVTNSTNSTIRKPAKKNATGMKAFIMAASLGITMGGWGLLAIGQTQNVTTNALPSQSVTTTNIRSNSAAVQNQIVVPNTQRSAIARSRSSR
jgi:hypothetical protein